MAGLDVRFAPPSASLAQYAMHFFLVHLELHIMQPTMSAPPHAQSHTAGARGAQAGKQREQRAVISE